MTKDTDTSVAIFGASRQQRRNTEIISMHARKQNEEAELVAVQASLQHRLRNAALLEAAPVHACYLDARLIDELGLKGPPGELRFIKNNRQHLDDKVGRPNSDQTRDALHNPLYVSGRRRRPSECELIGLHSSQRLMLVALDLSSLESTSDLSQLRIATAFWINDKTLQKLHRKNVIRPIL